MRIINQLNRAEPAVQPADLAILDLDGDGRVTPLDALLAINGLNESATDDFFASLATRE